MTAERSRLSLEIGGQAFDRWSGYSLISDMLVPSDAFSSSLSLNGDANERRRILELVDQGAREVKAYIYQTGAPEARRVLQFTGVLDSRQTKADKASGTSLSIQALDRAAHLVESSCDLTAIRNTGTNFLSLVQDLVRPWNIPVVADGTTSRDVASGLALRLPPNANVASRSAVSSGLDPASDPTQAQVFTEDEEALARERAAAAGRRRALAQVRALGSASIEGGTRVPTQGERNAIRLAQQRADSMRSVAQRRASETVSSNGQTATAIRAVSLNEARPQAGETIWNFILRHARRFGLVPWFSPDGKLIIASPSYGSAPTHRLIRRVRSLSSDPNNIIAGSESFNVGQRYSEVTVYGRDLGRDATKARIVGHVTDDEMPFPRPLVIQDMTIRDREEAQRRAQREMMRAQHGRRTLDYVVRDHGNGSVLYATDTMVEVDDEVLGIAGEWYVVSRTFQCDREHGTTTQLKLVEKGAILL